MQPDWTHTEAIAAREHSHYDHYSAEQIRRLDGFFGHVDEDFNRRIADHVAGTRLLDFGCGFGSLVEYLRRRGFDAVGIDLLDFQIEAGKGRFPHADLRVVSSGRLPFGDCAFDTVIFKESLHHVAAESDIESQMDDVARIAKQRIIVFDPNPSLPLKVGRSLIGHVDPMLHPSAAKRLLEASGFKVRSIEFLSTVAFPLSGGYVGRPLVSPRRPHRFLRIDDRLARLFGPALTWRYLLVADKS